MLQHLVRFVRALTLVAGTASVLSCASEAPPAPTRETALAINAPGLTPVPVVFGTTDELWDGNPVDLLVADAWSSCVWVREQVVDPSIVQDLYLERVHQLLDQATCAGFGLANWFNGRNNKDCNIDPTDGTHKSANLERHDIPFTMSLATDCPACDPQIWADPMLLAASTIRSPAVNLCIAQQLRSVAPGSAGAEALLLPSAQQRQLLEVTRQRAQFAVMQYATLGRLWAMPGGTGAIPTSNPELHLLKQFGHNAAHEADLVAMAEDFATAVQLLTVVAQEEAELLGRSASTHENRGGHPAGPGEEMWGSGSWRQRLMAMLYGGDAYAVEFDGSSPWSSTLDNEWPAVLLGGYPSASWPVYHQMPFFRTHSEEPQVDRLERLARGFDVLHLQTAPGQFACDAIDTTQTSSWLYRATEAGLRRQKCIDDAKLACFEAATPAETEACLDAISATTPPECVAMTPSSVDLPSPATLGDYLLWTKHRVEVGHAHTLAASLAETVSPLCVALPPTNGDFLGGSTVMEGDFADVSHDGAQWLQIGPESRFVPRPLLDVVGRFTRYTHVRATRQFFPSVPADEQGFPNFWDPPTHSVESTRLMGGISVLTAARDLMLRSLPDGHTAAAPAPQYFEQYEHIVNVIGGAIGDASVTVRNKVVPDAGGHIVTTGPIAVDVTVPKADGWWDKGLQGSYRIYAIEGHPWAATLARHPSSEIRGYTLAQLIQGASSALFDVDVDEDNELRVPVATWHAEVQLPAGASQRHVTFVARRTSSSGQDAYRLLVPGMSLFVHVANETKQIDEGQYISEGGALGRYAAQVLAKQPSNPSQPAFDGFGLPLTWIPPTNPLLFGGVEGVPSTVHYVGRAKEAAEQATAAVKEAFDTLLAQQADEAEASAADSKAAQVLSHIDEQLCGTAGSACDTTFAKAVPLGLGLLLRWEGTNWYPYTEWVTATGRPICDPNQTAGTKVQPADSDATIAQKTQEYNLACLIKNEVERRDPVLNIAQAVYSELPIKPGDHPGAALDSLSLVVPGFEKYQGGNLAAVFIEQWDAVVDAQLTVVQLENEWKAVSAQLAVSTEAQRVALQQLSDIDWNYFMACAALLEEDTIVTNDGELKSEDDWSWGEADGVIGGSGDLEPECAALWLQRQQQIAQLEGQLAVSEAEFVHTAAQGTATVVAQADRIRAAVARVRVASASIANHALQARVAREQAELEAELQKQTQQTSWGIYRKYHSYDLWRAKALLENARRYSSVARRAVESSFVVDFAVMYGPEAFVAGPASWADEVYAYDLSMPAAVGLSVGPSSDTGVYPNKLTDYVNNLQAFVDGYAVSRPTSVQSQEADVLTFAGPEGGTGTQPNGGLMRPQWLVYCPDGQNSGTWNAVPDGGGSMLACGVGNPTPTRAHVSFTLDAWGRLDADTAEPPFEDRYNARWNALAVNLVGTAIKECELAAEPLTCYAAPFVDFDLTHVGPAFVTSYEQDWRTFDIPAGRVEGGKALAAEQWLDPVANAWDKPYVVAISRRELAERPFGGTYELEITVGPEVQLDRIERVQILTSSSYWVRQQ